MSARHKAPSARVVRKAVDTLAGLGLDGIARLIELLDTLQPDPHDEDEGEGDACCAEDVPLSQANRDGLRIGDPDDGEPSLAWTDADAATGIHACEGDAELDRADDEPMLGTPIDPGARVLHGLDDGRE